MNTNATYKIFDIMTDEKTAFGMNGSMRLGAFSTMLVADSKVADIYGKTVVSERHRHRFEFNNKYKNEFEKAGMIFSGISEDLHFADVVELPDHPWFVGVQFHPEFNSSVQHPHPLFVSFIDAAINYSKTDTPKD